MPNLVEQIHQDHVNVSKVLDVIEREINRARDEQMPNLELLEDAMRYMVNYSDLIHHPKEDAMFARLVEKEPDVARDVEVLLQEHQTLASLSGAFLQIIKDAESGEFILRDEVVKRGTEYVDTLRSHMDAEEVNLLKRAHGALSPEDLEEIDKRYASSRDPLMEESLAREYATLYETLFA